MNQQDHLKSLQRNQSVAEQLKIMHQAMAASLSQVTDTEIIEQQHKLFNALDEIALDRMRTIGISHQERTGIIKACNDEAQGPSGALFKLMTYMGMGNALLLPARIFAPGELLCFVQLALHPRWLKEGNNLVGAFYKAAQTGTIEIVSCIARSEGFAKTVGDRKWVKPLVEELEKAQKQADEKSWTTEVQRLKTIIDSLKPWVPKENQNVIME
jgi:hypothetical protein